MPNTSQPRRRGKQAATAVSDEVLLATLQNKYVWCMTVRYVLLILALGALLWMATPLAHEVAGKNTNFNINITIALTAALGLTTVAGYSYANIQRKRASYLERRNRDLVARVDELQKELETYKEAIQTE